MKKKSILVYTVGRRWLFSNYGSLFQHIALRIILERMGYKTFRHKHPEESFYRRLRTRIGLLLCKLGVIRRAPHIQESMKCFLSQKAYIKGAFLHAYTECLPHHCRSYSEPDVLLFGSDQIWTELEGTLGVISTHPKTSRKIIYAASGDWTEVNKNTHWQQCAKKLFPKLSAISLRENAGIMCCKQVLPTHAYKYVTDPVFLLTKEDYINRISPKPIDKRPFLFVYLLNIRNKNNFPLKELERLAEILDCNLHILGIQGAENFIPKEYRIELTPSEFLKAYYDAKYIVTNSFHGTAFALLFQKAFISLKQSNLPGTNQNTRQYELLERHNLLSHNLATSDLINLGAQTLKSPIDWHVIEAQINVLREDSLHWLTAALTE